MAPIFYFTTHLMIQFATQDFSASPTDTSTSATIQPIITATHAWIEKAVIGLNLCPFAKSVFVKTQIRYAVSDAQTVEELLADFISELQNLASADSALCDTTLLIHPYVLQNFLDYNDFLDLADTAVANLGLDGEIQIASFHPDYQFAGTSPTDIGNYTNRSPYPILHLLRESSIERAVAAFPDASDIYEKNIETLHRIGIEGWQALGLAAVSMPSTKK